jgi:CHAT domain-containing protein/Tfp pilus assembly protein PilF
MIRRFDIAIILLCLAVLGGCAPDSGSRRTALEEAARLDHEINKLRGEGRIHDAIPLGERSLVLREGALGPVHLDVATSLGNLGLLFLDQAAFGKAEPLLLRALDIAEKTTGPRHSDVARHLNHLGELHRARGDFARAEPLLRRALETAEKALGPKHLDVARSLHLLGELHRARGDFARAEPLLRRALDNREQALGPLHPDVATSLQALASLLRDKGAYQQARSLYERALGIAEQALGQMHPHVARSLNYLAELHRMQGAYDEAGGLQTRALEIAEKALGPMHPDVALYLSNLGVLHWIRGAYARAEPLHVRALDIRENAFGPMHADVARSLNNLALVLQDQGAHGRVEPLYRRALEIQEKTLGPSHPHVATSLNNLATLYWEQGAYDKARPLMQRSVEIAEATLGPMHADVSQNLSNLALLHHVQGLYAEAEPLYLRALHIAENAFGPMHPDVAAPLTNLAWLYRDQRQYPKGEPLLLRALEVQEKALGLQHPSYAASLNNLAALYRDQGAYTRAEPLLLRTLEIRENALGPMHPEVARSLNSLAKLHWAQGTYDKAEPILRRAAEIGEAQLRLELPRLPEPRKRALMTLMQVETDSLVSLHAHAAPHDRQALDLALTTVLRRKGRILDSMVDGKTALRRHLTPQLRDQLDELDRAHTELVAKLYTPRSATNHAEVGALRARIDELESVLSAASADFRVYSEPVTVTKLQAALPPGTALVEFVRYSRFDPRQIKRSPEERYVAYLVTRHGPPRSVALGATPAIDDKVDAVLAALDDKVGITAAKTALRRLDAVVLAPIREQLQDVSHVIFAPDGKLNLVPFEALVDPSGRYALERYVVSYASTGRDLLRFAEPISSARPRSAATIFAAPDYGPSPSVPSIASFPPLASALHEAADLQQYFPTSPLTGAKATKSALKALAGPAMLHIATHGFYARDRAPRPMSAPGNPTRELFAASNSPLLPPPWPDDPLDGLDRAGLAMAGANQGIAGVVTARELAGFDWWGTQLVVLSACETGIGAVPSGDGVHGMRRALVLAGTASQIVSLWNVNDASTRELMRDFYAELARSTGRAEALRRAKLRMMRQPELAHPHHWAAFIPAGDWRPLDAGTISQQRHLP